MTECLSCGSDEYTVAEGAFVCSPCSAFVSSAVADTDQCTNANTVIVGGAVGGVLVVVIVGIVVVLIFYNPVRLGKNKENDSIASPDVDDEQHENDHEDVSGAYLDSAEPNMKVGIPQPPRPDRDGDVESDDKPKPKKTNIVPEKKKIAGHQWVLEKFKEIELCREEND